MKLLSEVQLFSVAALISSIFFKVTWSAQVNVDRKEQTILPGQNVTYMCRVAVPLQYCRLEIPGRKTYNLNRGISNDDVSYYGEGLDAGQCGFTIYRARDDNNGEIKCTLGIASEPQESIGTMALIVARAPKLPELDLSRGADNLNVYNVDDNLDAICIVKDGRPVANISWFLDEDPIDYNELMMPIVYDLAKENLQTKVQNLTRKLRATDNGKFLRCVAYHPAYPGGQAEAKRRLDIKYAPLPQGQPIEEFGYEIGKAGMINVTVEANPKPIFTWIVDGETIPEEADHGNGKIQAQAIQDLGNGRYLASLSIAGISKQDTEREYILKAYNGIGNMEYKVKISTNPEPKGVQVGVGIIAGIIIFILSICFIIFLTVFAKMTGRWCFSDRQTNRYLAESSDTESAAEVRPSTSRKFKFPTSFQLPSKTAAFFGSSSKKAKKSEENGEATTDDNITSTQQQQQDGVDGDGAIEKNTIPDKKNEKSLVYAELDLVSPKDSTLIPVLKNTNDKTEYAEIVYTKPKIDSGSDEKTKQPEMKTD